MKRISDNEKRLDKLNSIIIKLDNDLLEFEESLKDYQLLNKYYGSKKWFRDKEDFEKGKINNIKAGVLSEDAIWNLDEDMKDLINRMEIIINFFNENK